MARFNQKRGKQDDQIFFTDTLNQKDKDSVNSAYEKSKGNVAHILDGLLDKSLSVKIAWSDYNDSYTVTVSPLDRDHPSNGTFYSAFHADWKKAVVIVDYLLHDRYDYGDWSKDRARKFDNSW